MELFKAYRLFYYPRESRLWFPQWIPTVSESTESTPVDTYLEKARQAWTDDEIPTGEQLRDIAESVDMTPSESENADERAHRLTVEASEAFEEGNTDRAERLLKDAVLLSPVRIQPMYLLARLYAERYGETGDSRDRQMVVELGERIHNLEPDHGPTQSMLDKLGDKSQSTIPWKKATLIVFVAVLISGSLQFCHREFMTPEVDEQQVDEVREHFEEQGEPAREEEGS